ncbi:MAG: Fur family transcriptional regulator [Phycisphaerales bacterium]
MTRATEEWRIVEPLCAVFRRRLREEGLKYTPERARILDAIAGMNGLFEAERVLERLSSGGHRVSKATIYRTMRLLQDAGIIQRVPLDQDQAVYQLVYGGEASDYLIRLDTREVVPIEVPELEALRERICRERGLEARGHRFQVYAEGRDTILPHG